MFAEELGGSAARKRQEQARARRRQLKQKKQEKKAGAPTSATRSNAQATNVSETSDSVTSDFSSLQAAPNGKSVSKALISDGGPTSSSQPSAVALALQERKKRNQQKLLCTSAIKIQSCFRRYRSNIQLHKREGDLFDKRMSDLATLRSILEQAGKGDYVPPPATSSALATQMLFLAHRAPHQRNEIQQQTVRGPSDDGNRGFASGINDMLVLSQENGDRVASLINCVLLPGLLSDDDNMDPFLPWMQSESGRLRVERLLRLVLAYWADPQVTVPDKTATTIEHFFRAVLGVPAREECKTKKARNIVVQFCRKYLLKDRTCDFSSFGIVQMTRTLLLYGTAGSPLPPNAEKLREKCVSSQDRARAVRAFTLLLDTVMGLSDEALQSQFVSFFLTVPLLTWKVSSPIISEMTSGTLETPPSFVVLLRAFIEQNRTALSLGQLVTLLPSRDVPLTTCPAPGILCLLANLVQMGQLCTHLNGSDVSKLDFDSASMYFNLLSTVIDVVPLGAFSSRQSAVEWVSLGGTHHTPIVLSSVVIDQCKTLVLDSYVRQLFRCAIDDEAFKTDDILELKNEKDLKHEKELLDIGTASAASLAAKEAMIDRSKSFWQTSKWAKKLSQSVTSLLSGDSSKGSDQRRGNIGPKGSGKLLNTSSVSRHLARGSKGKSPTSMMLTSGENPEKGEPPSRSNKKFSIAFFFSLCRAYGTILARWGGGGKDDIVQGTVAASNSSGKIDPENTSGEATGKPDPHVLALLNVLCFATSIVKTTWAVIQSDKKVISDLYSCIDAEKRAAPIRTLKIRPNFGESECPKDDVYIGTTGAAVLFMFVTCLAHTLIITDDVEIHEMEKPLPQHQLRRSILLLKQLLYRACCTDAVITEAVCTGWESNHFGLALISAASKTMRDLYDRSSRRPLCVPKLWLVEDLLEKDIRQCKSHHEFVSLLSAPVLRVCPFLVSFKRRLKLFERIVTTDRIEIQGSNEQHNLKPGVIVRIMRGRVLEDGLMTLNNLGRNMRQRIVVQYLNQAGATETGVDVGGLFKEFWTDLSNLAFDPNYALFRATEGSGNCLYPNPSSRAAHGSDHIVLFEFLGRILGKALYEGITIQPQFAHFFLSFLRGDYNFLHMLPDLSTMDPQLYNNLMFLKTYDGDAADLCLTFTVANDDFGGNVEVALVPNGANIEVTDANKHKYVGLVAKHHVCDRVREQSEAFTRGLWEVIDRTWLQLFNEPELQVLISGASDGKIDVFDMKSNTRYAGGFTGLDKHVSRFWRIMSSFNSRQQADLLRFVTSCERPPPLGFASMNPPFTIQRVGIMRDGDKLPTASTCFNTLKLPTYSSEKVLKERLLYSIQAGAGFELT